MIDLLLVTVGAMGLVIAALSERVRRMPVSEPMLGLVAGVLLGPSVLGALDVPTLLEQHAPMHEASRVLLAISVMAVALRYPIAAATSVVRPVALLVVVAMPSMALLTAGISWVVLGVGAASALLLGAALCPTDPVLASSTVTGRRAEEHLPSRDRQILSLESGANDGLALPVVLLAVAVAGSATVGELLIESAAQVLGAVAVGLLTGWLGARALDFGEEHGASEAGPRLLATVLLALGVLGLSGLLHVDGILAVFVAGLAFNHFATGADRTEEKSIDEAVNRFMVLPLFVFLGASLPWDAWRGLGWRGPAIVVGVLLLRRLPVLFALARPLGLRWYDAVYVGWFGPVGVSALLYLTMEADRLGVDPHVVAAGALVVACSVIAHGLTAAVGVTLYARASAGSPQAQA